jgi:hypothetical protein
VNVFDVDPLERRPANRERRDTLGLVGGVVEHLHFKAIARVIHPADCGDQAVDDVHLVVDG